MMHRALLLTLLATGCAGSTVNPVGKWNSDCVGQPQADGTTQHLDLAFDISDDRWAMDYSTYGDDHEAIFRFDSKTITPHVDGVAQALGSMGCGRGAWAVGVGQDVLESGCAGFGQRPKAVCGADYDLIAVEGHDLHFGARPADNDMCTAEKRPTALSPLAMHRK